MEKKDEKSAGRHEEGKADASADDPMLKIEEDFESKNFAAVAQNKELDLYLVSFSCVIMPFARQMFHNSNCVLPFMGMRDWKIIGYTPPSHVFRHSHITDADLYLLM
jgi:hypothetical protein